MKVLFLTNIPSPYRIDFFNELGKKCELTVLFEKRFGSHRNKEWLSKPAKNFKAIFLKNQKLFNEEVISFSVKNYLNENLYDVIVIGGYATPTGMYAIQFCKMKNIPFILNTDGGMIGNDNKFKYAIKKYFISSAQAWLSTGLNTNKYLMHYGANENNIFFYPLTSIKKSNILKTDSKSKNILKDELKISNKPTVISVGSFIYRKGFDILLKAWEKVDGDYNLIIIGGGEKKQEFQELIKTKKLKNVKMIDFLPSDELSKYYMASDLFVFPTRYDIWGLVINEAMGYGLPIITTNHCVAGIELVKDNGFIIPSEDHIILANKIDEILKNEELKLKMGNKSLEIIQDYTIEKMADTHMNIFNKFTNLPR